MRELKLHGVVINSHTRSEYLDEQKFWPIFEAAEGLGAAIYIHPRSPSALMARAYQKYGLATGIYGFQAETGLHGIRLICSGVFDRFPDLRIVLGHLGEGIPFWLWRVDYMHPVSSSHHTRPRLALKPSEYFKRNFMITTSGMNWHPALRVCIEAVGADNIMWAIDYPYQLTEGAVEFMNDAPISDDDKHKIFQRNAERVFGIARGVPRPAADHFQRGAPLCERWASPGSGDQRSCRSSSCQSPSPPTASSGSRSRGPKDYGWLPMRRQPTPTSSGRWEPADRRARP